MLPALTKTRHRASRIRHSVVLLGWLALWACQAQQAEPLSQGLNGSGGSATQAASTAPTTTSTSALGGATTTTDGGLTGDACSAGQTDCAGSCVDLSSNSAHCGDCNNACEPGTACVSGACDCLSGGQSCAGVCVEVLSDASHCGACDVACQPGQDCNQGTCECQSGLQACTAGCTNLAEDGANCGSCGNVCAAGQVCSLGACDTTCADGLEQCDTSCVDLSTSSLHCGSCGNPCPAGQSCNAGVCGCSGGRALCDGECVDTSVSATHCGSCNNACAGGQSCSQGQCACPTGQLFCNGSCVVASSFSSDDENCGSCGNSCESGASCQQGSCVAMSAGGLGGSSSAQGGASSTTAETTSAGDGGSGGSTTVGGCGSSVTVDETPFDCELAWGANGNSGNRSSYLDFITTWVGYETNGNCDGCRLAQTLQNTSASVGYYAYFIGYGADDAGYGDCNTDANQNLCTHGAQWIRDNRSQVVDRYANYAAETYQASPSKSVVWLLEGDFVQYTYDEQTNPLSMQELGSLATDIVCAIKSNAPNSLVAINHSPWLADEETDSFWSEMPLDIIDFVWTTGVGNNGGYINSDANSATYNATTARYDYIASLTGKGILVDTSFGASQAADSWSSSSASDLNDRIGEGVIAVNVTDAPGDYESRLSNLRPQLASTCQ